MKMYVGIEQVKSLIIKIDFYEVLGCAPAIIRTIIICKVQIFLLLEDLNQKISPYFIIDESMHGKLIWVC
jgi:hypothetical protein